MLSRPILAGSLWILILPPVFAAVTSPALSSARQAAAQASTAFDRTVATLADILQAVPPRAGQQLTVRFVPNSKPLPIRPLFGPGAIAIDPVTRKTLYRTGQVVHFYPTPHPHFLVAVETAGARHRAVGVEVDMPSLAEALDDATPPEGGRIEVLSRDGGLLLHPEEPLSSEDQAQADLLAGHGAKTVATLHAVLAYAPIGSTGVGLLVSDPRPTAIARVVSSSASGVATLSPPVAVGIRVSPSPVAPARRERPNAGRRLALSPDLALKAGLAGAGLIALIALILWLRGRWQDQLEETYLEPEPEQPAMEAVGVRLQAEAVPGLQDALDTAAHAIERARMMATPRRLQEAQPLAQDLTEQAAGLRERLSQASQQVGTISPESTAWRDSADRVTQLALDLALAATQPDRLEGALKVVGQLRELAGSLAQRGERVGLGASSLPYLLELATALHGRCERLEQALTTSQPEDPLDWQLKVAHDAIEQGCGLLADLDGRLVTPKGAEPPHA